MNTSSRLIGTIAKAAVAGFVVTSAPAGTVGRDYVPADAATGASDVPAWFDLGVIEAATEETQSSATEIYRPSPGVLTLSDIKESKLKRVLNLTIAECSNPMWLLLRRALKATSPFSGGNLGQHVPLSGGTQKLWLKLQDYDGEDNSLLLIEQTWVFAKIDGAVNRGGDKPIQFKMQATQLFSPLNTATGN